MNLFEFEQRFFDVAMKWKLVFAFGCVFWITVLSPTDKPK